jgi:hypothetical protein
MNRSENQVSSTTTPAVDCKFIVRF